MDFLGTSKMPRHREQIQNQSWPPPPKKNAYTKLMGGEASSLPLHMQKFATRNGQHDYKRKLGVSGRQQSARRRYTTTIYDGHVESGEGLHLFRGNQPQKQQVKNKDSQESDLLFGPGRRQKRAKSKKNPPNRHGDSVACTQGLRHDKGNNLQQHKASNYPSHKACEGIGKKKQVFESYLTPEEVFLGLRRGELIQGQIRINPKNYQAAYLPSPDGARDIFLDGVVARNRALNGDVVVVQILPRNQWKHVKPDSDCCGSTEWDNQKENLVPVQKDVALFFRSGQQSVSGLNRDTLQKTGKVVFIVEKKHSRAATGFLKFLPHKPFALFSPVDHRVPRINIPLTGCPEDLGSSGKYGNTLYMCQITSWEADSNFAEGRLVKSLGQAGEVEPETEAILVECGVDFSEFSDEVLDCLPKNLPWTIPPEEIRQRRDLRKECVFTIDPATARDLDDALSCKQFPDGNFEVGVHIADVGYFVEHGSALDAVASQRATSVYLTPQKVIPMLPRELSEELCSLNPHCDRLAFSVIWKITSKGNILRQWFGRSVIRSCVKLSYDHAQSMIEAPGKRFTAGELPPVDPAHRIGDIHQAVLNLHSIAQNLQAQRFAGGALSLDQLKLNLSLDQETMMPLGSSLYQSRDSNKLVEEFMLLANISTAKQIYTCFPDLALLRCQPPPKIKMVDELQKVHDQLGIGIKLSSAGALQQSLHAPVGDDEYYSARTEVLTHMCSQPMQSASYVCTGAFNEEKPFRHCALNVALYTHFTSPIRRYADVIVHRLLAASLRCGPDFSLTTQQVQEQASHCNDKMMASYRVQKLSNELFFGLFVQESGHLYSDAVVMGVLDESFDVLALKYGVQRRIYCKSIAGLLSFRHHQVGKNSELILLWAPEHPGEPPLVQVISLFTRVDVQLQADSSSLKYSTTLRRPRGGRTLTQQPFFCGMNNANLFYWQRS